MVHSMVPSTIGSIVYSTVNRAYITIVGNSSRHKC